MPCRVRVANNNREPVLIEFKIIFVIILSILEPLSIPVLDIWLIIYPDWGLIKPLDARANRMRRQLLSLAMNKGFEFLIEDVQQV